MKYPVCAVLALVVSVFALAANSPSSGKTQEGKLSTASLLATARTASKTAPDGMRFLFLVKPKAEGAGDFTIKETRDFRLSGESYQEKTQAELGQRFEPSTVVDSAEKFFAKQPGIRHLAPEDIKGAHILAVTMGGAKFAADVPIEVTIHVGFGKEVESFTFLAKTPPGRVGPSKS